MPFRVCRAGFHLSRSQSLQYTEKHVISALGLHACREMLPCSALCFAVFWCVFFSSSITVEEGNNRRVLKKSPMMRATMCVRVSLCMLLRMCECVYACMLECGSVLHEGLLVRAQMRTKSWIIPVCVCHKGETPRFSISIF